MCLQPPHLILHVGLLQQLLVEKVPHLGELLTQQLNLRKGELWVEKRVKRGDLGGKEM